MSNNLLALYERYGLRAKRKSSTEYAGPCPACGGNDRFVIWPDHKDRPRWWCRQCGKSGDAIQFCREFLDMSYQEACAEAGREPKHNPSPARQPKPAWQPSQCEAPPDLWQKRARALVDWAAEQLWTSDGAKALEYLQGRRLTKTTIREARLGWIPWDIYRERESWGLPVVLKSNGQPKKLKLPSGITIPTFSGADPEGVKVRCFKDSPRYYRLPGSENRCYLAGQGEAVMVVESELDAVLLAQKAGNLITAVALGSASNRPDAETWQLIQAAPVVMISLDSDEAGAKAAWQWWIHNLPSAQRWPVPGAKDPTEEAQAGLNLRLWVEAGLACPPRQSKNKVSVGRKRPPVKDQNSTKRTESPLGPRSPPGLCRTMENQNQTAQEAKSVKCADCGLVQFGMYPGDKSINCLGRSHNGWKMQSTTRVHKCGSFVAVLTAN